jgi:hydrogenase nickel incorporation protein HypA/HybF
MHELAICRGILDVAGAALAERAPGVAVSSVAVRIGRLTGIDPECLRSYFDLLVAHTPLAGAVLRIEQATILGRCRACSAEFVVESSEFTCPACRTGAVDLMSGQELQVISLETVEEASGGD